MSGISADQTLWDRLEELKKGTTRNNLANKQDPPTVSTASTASNASAGTRRIYIPLNRPPTAHDKLSDRLRLLRLQGEAEPANKVNDKVNKAAISDHALIHTHPNNIPIVTDDLAKVESIPSIEASLKASIDEPLFSHALTSPNYGDEAQDPDSFLQSDDQTLEELLADLALDEDLDPEPPEWALRPSPVLPSSLATATLTPEPTGSNHGSKEAGVVSQLESNETTSILKASLDVDTETDNSHNTAGAVVALLNELSTRPMPEKSREQTTAGDGKDDSDHSDDSDGEAMKAKINEVLERTADEFALDGEQWPNPTAAEDVSNGVTNTKNQPDPGNVDSKKSIEPVAHTFLIPNPPSPLPTLTPSSKPSPPSPTSAPEPPMDIESRMAALLVSSPPSLPIVPHPHPAPINPDTIIPNFTSRLASLRASSSPSSPSSSVPPNPSTASRSSKATRPGFTDEDMETWCTICLEDATVICPGCEDDAYCTRCWHAMHTGPEAGFDERFHRAEILEKGGGKKGKENLDRLLVGA